ncbi:MAG: ribonuclease R [Gemmatimonadota bacterium]
MRDELLKHMAGSGYRPRKLKELARDLGVGAAEYRSFRLLVRELEDHGEVVRVGRNRYARPGQLPRVVGRLRLHRRGFSFVARSGAAADVLVQARHLAGAGDGDWVEVELLSPGRRGDLPEGRVVAVRQRPTQLVVGTLVWRGRRPVVRPDEKRWGAVVELDEAPPGTAREGDKVALTVTAEGPAGQPAAGRVSQVLGSPDLPATDFHTVVSKYGLHTEFPAPAQQEAAALPAGVEDQAAGRLDLRHLQVLTIDPEEARDFDDAVSLEIDSAGRYRLGVHVADVAHYVRQGSALDGEARERGTSVYLVDQVLPMLPERLSSHLCTLAPDQDRLALSVFLTIDAAGHPQGREVCESVIRSRARLTYEQVQAALDGRSDEAGGAAAQEPLLRSMLGLSQRLKARRLDRGAIDFDLPEPRLELDTAGEPRRLGRQSRLASHQLIEEFMLCANEAVARFAAERRLAVLYRTHRDPDAVKLAVFGEYVAAMGQRLRRSQGLPTGRDLQEVLRAFAGRPDADLVSQLLLRSMMRAEYSADLEGHFGLACSHYLHFTSPIRRYPDLLVHRAVKAALRGPAAGLAAAPPDLAWLGTWTTECERRADAAERDYVRSKQLRYMVRHLGEEYDGRVTGVLPGGIFAEVGDLLVEGYCPLSLLAGYYQLDEQRHCLVGQTGDSFRLGTAVRVRVTRVDLALQRLDLLVLSAGEKGLGRPRQRANRRPGRARHRRRR